ncbi:hypothetical protein T440DRAFT_464937 [Plenodomus tracheiphilus IPT5]|uniref:Ubiquitin-like-conjugating enzyme ATG10 n=1 Tax=Plenodomus tracheiphilus IPT5 TaxID=1408161 RepID=A0A6A7BK50_9PLEO|nr:hypothetical protein T440DRAFT_464937 [Plenodomus tracheiphilus IPT5]
MLSTVPHLTNSEFDEACVTLQRKFEERRNPVWISVDIIHQNETNFLRITKALETKPTTRNIESNDELEGVSDNGELELDEELSETDSEVFTSPSPTPLIHFDIILSPTYLVPTLYIHISDPLHRYPPTMSTLNTYLIPPEYRGQTDGVGVMGGVTIGDHPVTGRPVFYIHPCQTAGVMEEVLKGRMGTEEEEVTADEYLVMWIGALGGCVGLGVPLNLVGDEEKSSGWQAMIPVDELELRQEK